MAGVPTPAAGRKRGNLPARRHLRRLDRAFDGIDPEIYYITACVLDRRSMLADRRRASILVEAWQVAGRLYGWLVGRYTIMPDHVHFFASPGGEQAKSLSAFMGGWKRWTRREIRRDGLRSFAWQDEFFDHLLRSEESYEAKWEYVRMNPVRSGLVATPEEWPFQGELSVLRW